MQVFSEEEEEEEGGPALKVPVSLFHTSSMLGLANSYQLRHKITRLFKGSLTKLSKSRKLPLLQQFLLFCPSFYWKTSKWNPLCPEDFTVGENLQLQSADSTDSFYKC